jgi:hypothetical protein
MNYFTKLRISFMVLIIILLSLVLNSGKLFTEEPNTSWFRDIGKEVGLDSLFGSYINCVDINNDNYPDLLWGTGFAIAGASNTWHLYLNVGNPDKNSPNKRIFVDYTDESGINTNRDPNKKGRAYDVVNMVDVNNDGFVDMVCSIYYHRLEFMVPNDGRDHGDRSEVLLNDGSGHFKLVENSGLTNIIADPILQQDTIKPGLINCSGFSFLDYDLDGNLDLYMATWFTDYAKNIIMRDILMKGKGDGSFSWVEDPAIRSVADPLYGVNATDWNNDGWQDIITSPYCRSGGNLFENLKNGTFQNSTIQSNYSSQHLGGDWYQDQTSGQWLQQPACQWEAPPADFDNDGDMDFVQLLVHGGFESRNGIREAHTTIAINNGPPDYRLEWDLDRIRRNELVSSHLGDYAASWFDMDNDGWLDLNITQGHYTPATDRLYICKQDTNHYFNDITDKLGLLNFKDASEVQSCDFDLDGDEDFFVAYNDPNAKVYIKLRQKDTIITVNVNRIVLLRNDIGTKNNWTEVKLTQPDGANQSGIGSRVYVYSDGLRQIREIQAGLGHISGQRPFITSFGLNKINRIDSIVVRWQKNGLPQTIVHNPPMNVVLNIDETGYRGVVANWRESKPAIIALGEPYLAFGEVKEGETKEMRFTIKNIGGTDLNVQDIYLENDKLNSYKIKETQKSFALQPNNSLTFTVVFSPLTRDENRAVVTIKSDAYNCPLKSLDLLGSGFKKEPMLSLSTSNIQFEDTWIDTLRTSKIELENKGELTMNVTEIKFLNNTDGSYSYSGITVPFQIEAGKKTEITVNFKPKKIQAYNSNLVISSNAYNLPNAMIKLTGNCNGPDPIIAVNTSILFFSNVPLGESKDLSIIVNNNGNATLSINSFGYVNNTDNAFSVFDLEIPCKIDLGTSKEIPIRFTPNQLLNYSTDMIVNSNATNEPAITVKLRGRGVDGNSVEYNEKENSDISLEVFPNPVTGNGNLICKIRGTQPKRVRISLIDPTGREVAVLKDEYLIPDIYDININSGNLSAGLYYLVARSGNSSVFQRLVIMR